jgi:hypothetical protein
LIITGFCSSENALGQQSGKWRIKNRLQASFEFDDNIREAPSQTVNKIKDSSLKFLFHSQASWKSSKTRISFTYRGGFQTYLEHAFENKLINEFETTADLKIKKFAIGLRGAGRLKIYLNDILDYVTGSAEFYLRLPQLLNFGSEVAFKTADLSYQNFSAFDYSENQVKWAISKRFASRFTLKLELSGRQVKYDRSAMNFIPLENGLSLLNTQQKDNHFKARYQLSYAKAFLINFNYSFERNNSNSFGYDYYKHQIILIFGFQFPQGIWLRGYGATQVKNYSEDAIPMFPTDIDTEREESNFIVLDFSKDLHPGFTALLRLAYYNNESIIRSRFYSKTLITLGFDFRF